MKQRHRRAYVEIPQTRDARALVGKALVQLGFPLSTTQVCSGAIFGAGAGKRLATVRWSLTGQMALAWLCTMPSAAILGAASAQVAEAGTGGTVVVALSGLAISAGIYALARRRPVHAGNVNAPAIEQPAPTSA